jgi:predicted Fe-S protein YdhL (DUF1289 family)
MMIRTQPAPIPSPCVRTCRLEREVCAGCGRTLAEIAAWSRMTPAERGDIMERLKGR